MTPQKFRDCSCPNTPHPKGDTVTFHEKLPFEANVAALSAIFSGEGESHINKAWKVYLHDGPAAWNLVDAEGDPIPLTREALDELPFEDQWEIADRADDIYQGTVLAPLVRKMKQSSETGPIIDSPPRRTRR